MDNSRVICKTDAEINTGGLIYDKANRKITVISF